MPRPDRSRARSVRWPALLPSVALALLIGLAGCGSSDNGVASKSGAEILAASKAAAKEASSVHVVSRTAQGPLSAAVDLRLARNGGRGQVSLLGVDFEAIRIDSTVYVKGSPAFYRRLGAAQGIALHVPQGTWLKGAAKSGPLAQLAAFTNLPEQLNRLLSTPGSVAKGSTTRLNGQRVIELKETTKVYKGVLYVAASGKPYPVALVKSGGKAKNERERGRTTFSGWDRGVSLLAPSPAVDVGGLARRPSR